MKSYLTTLCYLVKGDKVLMLHRVVKKNDVNKDKWIGVGGHFEKNESPEDCARREIFEETGLVVTKLDLRAVVTFISGKMDHAEYMFLFLARDWTGTPHECDEGVLAWTDFDAVKKLELWEGDRIFLKLVSENHPFFSLKLTYDADDLLKEAVLDGEEMELFDILGEDGKPTGLVRERSVAHEMGTLHQTVHMWVVRKRPDGSFDLLVQKRAKDKDSYPGCLDISSAGHMHAGDGMEESVVREFSEELGIKAPYSDFTFAFDHRSYHESVFYGRPFRDAELSHVHIYEKPVDIENLTLQKEEVESVQWISLSDLAALVLSGSDKTCVDKDELRKLASYLEIRQQAERK